MRFKISDLSRRQAATGSPAPSQSGLMDAMVAAGRLSSRNAIPGGAGRIEATFLTRPLPSALRWGEKRRLMRRR